MAKNLEQNITAHNQWLKDRLFYSVRCLSVRLLKRNELYLSGSYFTCRECAGESLDHDISLIIRNQSNVRCGILLKGPSGNCQALYHDGYSSLNEATIFFAKTDQQALK